MSFNTLAAAQKRNAMPTLSEIPDAALAQPLPFRLVSEATTRTGQFVVNGTVEHDGVVYRAAIFGMGDALAALGGQAPKVGLVLNIPFARNATSGGVFFVRSDAVTPAEARATVAGDDAVAAATFG